MKLGILLALFSATTAYSHGDHVDVFREVYGDQNQFMVIGHTAHMLYDKLAGTQESSRPEGKQRVSKRSYKSVVCYHDDSQSIGEAKSYQCEFNYTTAKGLQQFKPEGPVSYALYGRMLDSNEKPKNGFSKRSVQNLECTLSVSGNGENESYSYLCSKNY